MISFLFFGVAVLFQSSLAVEIRAHYPHTVGSMYIRGDSCSLNWDKGVKMVSKGGNIWSADLNCPSSVTSLEVKVLVDDRTWMLGSNHHVDAKTEVSDMFPWFYTYKGTLSVIKNVYSKELNNSRDVIFYLPPSYEENTLKVHKNVLVMHDGQNLFNKATAYMGNAWMCQDSLDSTIIGGTSDEIMVVGPYNTADRINEYTYIYDPSEEAGGKGDLYLDWIESTLIPLTSKTYRVDISRDNLGILGSSLGGLISCYAVWTRSDVYGKAGCMSSSFWWDENDFQNVVVPKSVPPKPFPKIYMDSGTGSVGEKECTAYTQNIFNQFLSDGFIENTEIFKYVDEGATHSESYWGPRFYIPTTDLYPATSV